MKIGTRNAYQGKKPALLSAKDRKKRRDSLPALPLLDAWLARPQRQPENLLVILRNRSN